MKQTLKRLLSIAALSAACVFNAIAVSPTYRVRSQGRNKVRQVAGSVGHVDLYGMENWWGTFSITPEYTQSFRNGRICECLFGNSTTSGVTTTTTTTSGCCDTDCNSCDNCSIRIQGSGVADRDAKAWFADYFYLPTTFDGSISFKPSIRNFNLDFDLYVGLDKWVEGMYFRVYGPFTHTRWNLDFCETISTLGTATGYQPGYFTPNFLPNSNLLATFKDYAAGRAPAAVTQNADVATATVPITTTFNGLCAARLQDCENTANGFADLRAELGWNFWQDEDYHVGLNIQAAAPTGTRLHAQNFFQPVIGNGRHWELGGGLTAHYVFWRSEDSDKHFGFYLDANLTHLFNATQNRTFDLKNKPMSRYMLASKFGANTQALRGTSTTGTLASNQFVTEYAPVANLTTMDVNVSVGVQADIVAMFNFTAGGFSWDLGYNFWGHGCEKIGRDCDDDCDTDCKDECNTCPASLCDSEQENTWALKGNARMYGYAVTADATAPAVIVNQAVPLSATDSKACITGGNTGNTLNYATGTDINLAVDNPQIAFAGGTTPGTPSALNNARTLTTVTPAAINTSIQPIFLQCCDINFSGIKGISQKVFTHLSYTWERDNWSPYIGAGVSAEFGKTNCGPCGDSFGCGTNSTTTTTTSTTSGCCETDCNSCDDCCECALSQWGVWVKMGVSFN